MTITTKAALADELGVTRARVSQYVKAGLPVRVDGKLDRDAALNWIALNNRSLNTDDRGAVRAASLVRKARSAVRKPQPDPIDVLATILGLVGKVTAESAVASGASMRVAYVLDHIVTVRLWLAAERLLGIPAGSVSPFESAVDGLMIEPDWNDLAAQAGEPVDIDAWDAFVAAHPMLQPPAA